MKTRRLEILLVSLVVLALGAGVMAGMLAARMPAKGDESSASPIPPASTRSPLEEELSLTPEQRDGMRDIWEGVRRQTQHYFQDAQDLQRQRDEELMKLLTPEQRAQFEKLSKDCNATFAEIARQREQTFAQAVEETKKLLSEPQRLKYDRILKRRVGSMPPAATAPATQ